MLGFLSPSQQHNLSTHCSLSWWRARRWRRRRRRSRPWSWSRSRWPGSRSSRSSAPTTSPTAPALAPLLSSPLPAILRCSQEIQIIETGHQQSPADAAKHDPNNGACSDAGFPGLLGRLGRGARGLRRRRHVPQQDRRGVGGVRRCYGQGDKIWLAFSRCDSPIDRWRGS